MDKKSLLTPRLSFIRALPANIPLRKEDLCVPELVLHREREIEIYYAPFDYVNLTASIVIIGITPGWQQMAISYEQMRDALLEGATVKDAQMRAEVAAAFAGSMRSNLIKMLNGIGVPKALDIESTEQLFSDKQVLAQTTSAVRYPVFVNGQNYTGHTPSIFRRPVLEEYWRHELAEELGSIKGHPLIVPLGDTVTKVLEVLIKDNTILKEQSLLGFPHPSGGNGHRTRQFYERKDDLENVVQNWLVSRK